MIITKERLRQVIKEELSEIVGGMSRLENSDYDDYGGEPTEEQAAKIRNIHQGFKSLFNSYSFDELEEKIKAYLSYFK